MERGRDVGFGATHMTTERWYSVPLPPIFGAIALIGGIALLLMDKDDFNPAATP
jgi:Ni/Fe-hydrogenase subunit HybB-like protein